MPKKILNKLTTRASFVFFTLIVFIATGALTYRARRFDKIYPNPLGPVAELDRDACNVSANVGPCKAYIERYHFDKNTETCEQFIWGGCGGSVPFDSLEMCKNTCEVVTKTTSNQNSVYSVYTKYILPYISPK